ncbi:MAG: LPS assembly lipoprotein LptE [Gammaproteobacteria bacterium]|nr:LPS assembly lipoprotein LptE [Gammaproteobacteria bacterium]MDP2141919.1 LPS assembly lipoprotein LptE [Gammaproteobacteria bacterium]MDP2347199.1 LPS assembly lipoprotein LptE [Gammaproteobacteria bacterium]
MSLVLAGCGFALRGSEQTAMPITTVELRAMQQNSPFMQQLRDALANADVSTSPAGGSATYILSVGEEQTSTRTASVNSRARAAQYDLQLAVSVQLDGAGITVFGPETLSVQRSYYEDIANIAGSNEEMELLRTEMRRELVEQLLRRLRVAANSATSQ